MRSKTSGGMEEGRFDPVDSFHFSGSSLSVAGRRIVKGARPGERDRLRQESRSSWDTSGSLPGRHRSFGWRSLPPPRVERQQEGKCKDGEHTEMIDHIRGTPAAKRDREPVQRDGDGESGHTDGNEQPGRYGDEQAGRTRGTGDSKHCFRHGGAGERIGHCHDAEWDGETEVNRRRCPEAQRGHREEDAGDADTVHWPHAPLEAACLRVHIGSRKTHPTSCTRRVYTSGEGTARPAETLRGDITHPEQQAREYREQSHPNETEQQSSLIPGQRDVAPDDGLTVEYGRNELTE